MQRRLPKGPNYDADGMRLQQYSRQVPCEVMDGDETDALLEMSIKALKRTRGRPAEYANTSEGLDSFTDRSVEYLQFIKDTNADPESGRKLMPDIESWAVFLGVTRMTISNYRRRSEDWNATIEQFKTAILAVRKQLASNFKIPPVYAIFDQTNNYGYVNSTEFHLVPETEAGAKQPQSLESIAEQLGIEQLESMEE